jgi:hypothetical protein
LNSVLWNAAQHAGKDDQSEIERIVDFGLDHPDTTPVPVER